MAAPFKLYISYSGYYPIPAVRDICTRLPIPVNLTWTELTPSQILKNNLELIRGIDKDVSEIAIRTQLKGDFTVFGSDYDSLLNSLTVLNFNELILKIERYNGSTYDEYWRGTTEIRGSFDANRKISTLSKFTTIDDYTDFLRYRKTNTIFNRPAGAGNDIKMEVKNSVPVTIQQAIYGQGLFITTFHDSTLTQYSKTLVNEAQINYDSNLFPTFYRLHGLSDDGVNSNKLFYGSVGMAVDFLGNTDAELTISHQKVFDLYEKLFDASWYIDEPYNTDPCPPSNNIFLRRKRDTFNTSTVHTFTSESADFKQYKYILPKLFTQQVHQFSKKNVDASHVNANYTFVVNGDLEQKISESSVFTDAQRIYDANIGSKEDDWLNDDEWFIGVGNQPVNGVPAWIFKEGTTQIGLAANYEMSLAWRMANDINDFQQLDSATYNGSIRSLNPNFALPAIEQTPFPINTTDIGSLDFYGITVTSLGNMRITEAKVGFNNIKSEITCIQ